MKWWADYFSGKDTITYIVVLEVPTLNHEILDDSVEGAALVTVLFLSCANPKKKKKELKCLSPDIYYSAHCANTSNSYEFAVHIRGSRVVIRSTDRLAC